MSTGSISLDILLNHIVEDALAESEDVVNLIRKRYPALSEKESKEIFLLVADSVKTQRAVSELVATTPPSFTTKTKSTKVAVDAMIRGAEKSILITGYSLSDYFADLIECIIRKSQQGVFVKFFVNDIGNQKAFERLCSYKSKFLKIYNYPKGDDKMAALHAKVIVVDQTETLITSANLSYHGQEGNIELGTKITSPEIARQVDDIFTKLLFSKIFVEM